MANDREAVNDVSLDVRTLPHTQRHSTIFSILERIHVGQALVLTVDHNPLPLCFQLRAMYGDGAYSWTYLQDGPDVWRVAIRKVA